MKKGRKVIFLNDNGGEFAKARPVLDRLYALKEKAEKEMGVSLHWYQVMSLILDKKVTE